MMWRSTIFLLIAILHLTTSASLCGSSNEIPIHNNVPPMTTNSPFSILTSVSTAHQSEIVTLRIKSILSELKFEGFIVHAFSTSRGEILGRFRSSREGLKLNNCNSDDNIAIYQAYPEGTYEAELQWQAPNDYVGEISFNATIVQDFNTFWVDVTSNPLKVVQDEEPIVKSFLSSPAVRSRQNVLLEAYPNTPIYEGCGSTKTCFGFPFNCEQERSCQAIATATINDDNRFIFELQSLIADAAYIALGLSRSHLMGNCSVMECVREDGSVKQYNSWNLRRSNHRVDVPQNITRLLDSSTIDGSIYCKFEREPYSIVLENEFDLQAEDFYFLIAMGTTFSATAIGSHNRGRNATQGPLEIIREVDPIYRGCGTTKACFGMPIGCLNVSSCDAVGAVLVRDEEYEIELQSEDIRAAYVSFGLSEDEYMGDDSVIECVVENGVVRSYASWNTPQPNLGNTRQGLVQQDIITHIDSSYSDGKIYCKVRREKATVILGHEFNMAWQDFHFMLATGTGFTANSINRHDLGRLASVDAFVLPGRRSDAPYVRISAIAIVTWLLATSIGQFFRGL